MTKHFESEMPPLGPEPETYVFEYTADGYILAKQWLRNTGNDHLIERELSTDGYTLVALAQSLLNELK